ncbi:MAG: hypothetical protein WCS43_16130 [Verrucomicrobiota bacterium]
MSDKPDIRDAWKQASGKFRRLSAEGRLKIFVNAGVLTASGNVRKPYRKVIVPVKAV